MLKLLKAEIDVCDLHVQRLTLALNKIRHIFPLTAVDDLEEDKLAYLELMTARFGKLQDTIGRKVFPLLLSALGERVSEMSVIDRLNRLEKLGILESREFWDQMREIRNSIAHDYPNELDLMTKSLNTCFDKATDLINFWQELKKYIEKRDIVMQSHNT